MVISMLAMVVVQLGWMFILNSVTITIVLIIMTCVPTDTRIYRGDFAEIFNKLVA